MGKWVWIAISLLGVNLLILDVWVLGGFDKRNEVLGDRIERVVETETVENEVDGCDEDCVIEIIDEKLGELVSKYGLVEKKEVKTVSKPVVKPTSEKFVRISGGDSQGSSWTRLNTTAFWLDSALHGELVEASWQGWLEGDGGDLDGWVRLYDATNSRVVDGSEVRLIGSEKVSFYSGNISIWRGQNQYYVELKNLKGGRLTISEPRLKLVVR